MSVRFTGWMPRIEVKDARVDTYGLGRTNQAQDDALATFWKCWGRVKLPYPHGQFLHEMAEKMGLFWYCEGPVRSWGVNNR
jgi:hypothetical protein